jgi:uncharacterized OB-fold protein
MSEQVLETAARVKEGGESARTRGRDPVNLPAVRNWLEALGDTNPIYTDEDAALAAGHPGLVAPPAMIQVWTMPGLGGKRAPEDPLSAMMTILDESGFTSVVATNCEQVYHRYLRQGEEVTVSAHLSDVVGPKRTALGEGWFVTVQNTWFVDDEPVAEMLFRVLKFRPPAASSATEPDVGEILRPVVSRDTEFFWQGTGQRELRVQKCGACGTLRHPPGPLCMACGSDAVGYEVVDGVGSVFSYVVHHRPAVPGRRPPFVVALVELECGVRMLGELKDIDPNEVEIGCPVEVVWQQIDDELTLPAWRPRGTA